MREAFKSGGLVRDGDRLGAVTAIRERESDNIQSAASSVELFLQRSHQVDASNLTVSNRPNRLAKVILKGGPLHRGRINPWALVGNDFLSPKGFASVGRP
jgi:hypothetical protein